MTPCFYQSNTDRIKEIDPEELTITFACSRYPREMLNHLLKVRGIHVESQDKGIYYLTGDAIPIRIDSGRKLLAEESPDGSDHAGKLDRNGGRVKNVRCVKRTLC